MALVERSRRQVLGHSDRFELIARLAVVRDHLATKLHDLRVCGPLGGDMASLHLVHLPDGRVGDEAFVRCRASRSRCSADDARSMVLNGVGGLALLVRRASAFLAASGKGGCGAARDE
jgi:hypothetical protein